MLMRCCLNIYQQLFITKLDFVSKMYVVFQDSTNDDKDL